MQLNISDRRFVFALSFSFLLVLMFGHLEAVFAAVDVNSLGATIMDKVLPWMRIIMLLGLLLAIGAGFVNGFGMAVKGLMGVAGAGLLVSMAPEIVKLILP